MVSSVVASNENDLVLSVRQDNLAHNIVIVDVNKPMLDFLMLNDKRSVVGTSLYSVLDLKTQQTISSYIEYTDDGVDLADVVSKMANFSLLKNDAQSVLVKPRIFRVTSEKGAVNYEIIMRDVSISQKLSEFRKKKLGPAHRHKLHETFGILSPRSVATEISVVLSFSKESSIDVVLAMAAIDPPVSETHETTSEVYRTFGNAISANLRYTDIVGYAGNKTFVFILLGCKDSDALPAVSRIHRHISDAVSKCLPEASVSIGYSSISGAHSKHVVHEVYDTLRSAQQAGCAIKPWKAEPEHT